MITLTTASEALKTIYLGVIAEQLNTKINPFLSAIEKTSNDVYGKEVKKLITYGVNGGISSGTEAGTLPRAGGNNYLSFTLPLKNFYGKISVSDKALRASTDSTGAFVNLLNAEMEGLIAASKRNFGRMLFGDGTGKLCKIVAWTENTDLTKFKVDDISKLDEGMLFDVEVTGAIVSANKGKRIAKIDKVNKVITMTNSAAAAFAAGSVLYVQESRNNELTGLGAIFGSSESLYGLNRVDYSFLSPYVKENAGAISANLIQDALDNIEEAAGGSADFITTSYAVRKKYVDFCTANNRNMDVMNLDSGYKAISYSGIPIVVDRYCGNQDMYLLNTADFKLHQLCDWRWIEDAAGGILKQDSSFASFSATLVKYADMMCERPAGQAKITGITI